MIVECTVPARDFRLGNALRETEYTRAELERVVATGLGAGGERITPFFWVVDADMTAIETTLGNAVDVTSVRLLDAFDDRALFRVEMGSGTDRFVRRLLDLDVAILEAIGSPDR